MLRHLIQKEKMKPLGAKDALAMSHRTGLRTMEYDSVKGKSLKQLLPTATSGVLLLLMDKRKPQSKVGHWILFFRSPECGVVLFEPYGLGLRSILKVSKNPNLLQKIMSESDVHVNKQEYQKRDHAETCARHCVTRWNAAHLKPKDYAALMHDPRLSPDDVVIMLTLSQDLTQFKA